jgi:hypothetical protein
MLEDDLVASGVADACSRLDLRPPPAGSSLALGVGVARASASLFGRELRTVVDDRQRRMPPSASITWPVIQALSADASQPRDRRDVARHSPPSDGKRLT